jgi:hypothetical protein
MQYHHRVPRPPLDAFIQSIWVYQHDPRPHALERVLPIGAAQFTLGLAEIRPGWMIHDDDAPVGQRLD